MLFLLLVIVRFFVGHVLLCIVLIVGYYLFIISVFFV